MRAHIASEQGAITSHALQTESAEARAKDESIRPEWGGQRGLHGCLHGRACAIQRYDSEPRNDKPERRWGKNLTGCGVSLELEENMSFTYKSA
jgi:hypothetical protein